MRLSRLKQVPYHKAWDVAWDVGSCKTASVPGSGKGTAKGTGRGTNLVHEVSLQILVQK